jgi:ABC-type branched-subunit amino acid transport system substrate-binding protein
MRKPWAQIGAAAISLALLGAACGGDDDDGGGATATTAAGETSETTAADSTASTAAGGKAGALEGMKGTTPLVELSADFKTELNDAWVAAGNPALTDYNYAAETYDAITIVALAVEKAGTDGVAYANEINGITRGGQECTDFTACKAIIDAGGDPDYNGLSGPLEFSGNGEPLEASYGVLQFGSDNRLDDSLTEYRKASAPTAADVAQQNATGTRAGDGVLKIGSILPQTGSLAFLGPPEFAGFDLAIADINAAGGVLGQPVVGIKGDSGDATTDTVNQTTDRMLAEQVDAIIGAASSGVSLKVIDKITGAGVVQFSPANTSKTLSTYDDKGLYFRTAPSDILQGQVLGELIAEDGNKNVAIINRNDSYGVGLAEDLTKALEEAGATVVLTKTYDEKADKFNAEVNEIAGQSPDAVMIIGFEESSKILATMVEAGIGPKDVAVYGCDGNMGNSLGETFDAGE